MIKLSEEWYLKTYSNLTANGLHSEQTQYRVVDDRVCARASVADPPRLVCGVRISVSVGTGGGSCGQGCSLDHVRNSVNVTSAVLPTDLDRLFVVMKSLKISRSRHLKLPG